MRLLYVSLTLSKNTSRSPPPLPKHIHPREIALSQSWNLISLCNEILKYLSNNIHYYCLLSDNAQKWGNYASPQMADEVTSNCRHYLIISPPVSKYIVITISHKESSVYV